jgi:hypothetical protein
MDRRDFLAAGMTGYSVLVFAGDLPPVRAAEEPGRPKPDFDRVAPPKLPRMMEGEPHMALVDLECDVLVAGGGMAGVCAALSAARHGAKVVLVQDRSRLGGNSSSEVKMHVVGADCSGGRPGWREGGLIEAFRLQDAVRNPQRCFELWDLLLYDKIVSEPNITLILDSNLYAAETKAERIERVLVRCDKTEHIYRIAAKIYCDCTGDSRLGLEAGAEYRIGREAKSEFNESLGREQADDQTLGSSILFTARQHERSMPFVPPKWARKITKEMLRFRGVRSWEYGYWWIEWGGQISTIRDNERIRFELLSIVMGVWDYIKNSGNHPDSDRWALDWVGMLPGKRGSRRLVGDYLLTQHDLEGKNGDLEDAVAIGGWPFDDHPPSGFDKYDEPATRSIRMKDVYSIPLRSLYSKNIRNLMMAGRNISASHVAFTSSRVMATCSVIGQATGTAAALCVRHRVEPRRLYEDVRLRTELQQTLLRDDQSIKGLKNQDPKDLARKAKLTASAELPDAPATKIIDGFVRDIPKASIHRWSAPMTDEGAWIELSWDRPQTIREIQITFDSGFQRKLTLTAQDGFNAGMVRAPQPETVRDYSISYRQQPGGTLTEIAKVEGNFQRLNRHSVEPISARSLRLHVHATNGDKLARVFEVRCYG